MKKSELKSTLGSIRASDELVKKTMLAVHERKTAQKKEPFFLRTGWEMRLAGTACALLMVVTLTLVLGQGGMFRSFDSDGSLHLAHETADMTDTPTVLSTASTRDALELLREDAEYCTGEWAIIKGNLFYASVLSEPNEGTYPLEVRISVEKTEECSGDTVTLNTETDAYALFSDEDQRQKLADSINKPLSLLIEKDEDGKWTIKRIVY